MTFSSTEAFGGVRGEDIGIVLGTMTGVGPTTVIMSHMRSGEYPRTGGTITGTIVGEGASGIMIVYPITTCRGTGGGGSRTRSGINQDIGRLDIPMAETITHGTNAGMNVGTIEGLGPGTKTDAKIGMKNGAKTAEKTGSKTGANVERNTGKTEAETTTGGEEGAAADK